jgi:excisionase family DNA binding protein
MSDRAIPETSHEYCGTSYAAKLLNLSVGTVQTLVEKNELIAWKTQGGHRRICIQSIRDYQNRASFSPNVNHQDIRPLKVMVVEDDELTRSMFQMHFERWDLSLDTTITASAIEALLDIPVLKPQVLLTDLRMPGIDGVEMLRQLHIHPQFAQMAVIVITGLSDEEIAAYGELPAGTLVLRKPLDMGWLCGYFQAMLSLRQGARRRFVAPQAA